MAIGGASCLLGRAVPVAVAAPQEETDAATTFQQDLETVYTLKSGIQFRNDRIGQGPPVTEDTTVVLHVQCLLRNGSILMDTRQDGRPVTYVLGSALRSSPPTLIPPGVDDALVSRGTDVQVDGRKLPPMRQGGIRRVVVPAPLGYGHEGVSRYQILSKLDNRLRQPVPRDELLRYEIEVLRCTDVGTNPENNGRGVTTVQACCPEDVFPCPTPNRASSSK